LDAYEAALKAVPGAKDARLRIEHAQHVRRADVPRFARLGIIASMQPAHVVDEMRWAEARLGPDRVRGAYAWRWFVDENVRLAFGSDFPVAVANPFLGLYAATTRQDETGKPAAGWYPEQKISLDEALRAYTSGSAFAAFADRRLGQLKLGMRADLTAVDRDLFKVTPRELLKTKVVMTIVDGEVLYDSERR
jgi:predicted amidohydrolase YtcJ